MSTIARRRGLSFGHPATEWKRGVLRRPAAKVEEGGAMGNDLLATFFARYPSALGNTHIGGQYRIICPECGHLVSVAALDETTDRLSIYCENCEYSDEIVIPPTVATDTAA